MWKYIKKHRHKVLAVTMALLLVAWLGGSALTTLLAPKPGQALIAHTKYGDIKRSDQQQATNTTNLLLTLGINWSTLNEPNWSGEPLSVIEWVLLSREARRLGLVVTGRELDERLRASGISDAWIQARAVRSNITPEQVKAAIAEYVGIQEMLNWVAGSVVTNEAEVRVAARDRLERATIQAVVLDASDFVDENAPVTEDELEALFKAHRDSQPVENSVIFGYFQPARVKVQYIRIDRAAVEANLRASEAVVLSKAKAFWREHKQDPVFRRPPKPETTQPATQPTTGTQPTTEPTTPTATAPATQPGDNAQSEFYETFPEARDAAMAAVKKQLAAQATDRLARWLDQQFGEPWFEAPTGADKFKIPPPRVTRPGYCEDVASTAPPVLAYPEAVQIVVTDWFDSAEANLVPDIGRAQTELSNGRVGRLANLAFLVEGLAEVPTEERYDPSLYLSRYQFSSYILHDADDNLYLFRVTDVKPPHSPENLDAVRDEVVADLRLKRGYDAAKQALETLKQEAVEDGGLVEAWDQDETLKAKLEDPSSHLIGPVPVTRAALGFITDKRYISGIGLVSADFVDRCFALGEESTDGPRLAVLEIPDFARVALIQWIKTAPLTSTDYLAQHDAIAGQLLQTRLTRAVQDWLDPKEIRIRNGYEAARRESPKAEEQEEKETTEEKEKDAT
jgi:hypothetical protein